MLSRSVTSCSSIGYLSNANITVFANMLRVISIVKSLFVQISKQILNKILF